jgi:hypothetical protein
MRKLFATIKGLFVGRVSIDVIHKTRVSRTPGDVTPEAHN